MKKLGGFMRGEERQRSRFSESGFTLLEALLAIVLTGILLATLTVVTGHWIKGWKTGFGRLQSVDLVALGVDRIASDIAAAQYVSLGGDDAKVFFEGTESSVIFIRSAIGPNAAPGLEIVRLAETEDERGRVLVRDRIAFATFGAAAIHSGDIEFTNPVVLMHPPFRVIFAFAGRDRVWKDSWLDTKQLPSAVRIGIHSDETGETVPLSTATLISVSAPPECAQGTGPTCDGK